MRDFNSSRAESEHPHWTAPMFTVTPRLVQQFRYAMGWQLNRGFTNANYGNSKGLELVPLDQIELYVSAPPCLTHTKPGIENGIGDMTLSLSTGRQQVIQKTAITRSLRCSWPPLRALTPTVGPMPQSRRRWRWAKAGGNILENPPRNPALHSSERCRRVAGLPRRPG